jgi:hypothetical protein
VVDVALLIFGRERVDRLRHPHHRERRDRQDLGLSTLEETRAVCARQQRHLGSQRSELIEAASIDPDPVLHDPAADDLLRQGLERRGQLA